MEKMRKPSQQDARVQLRKSCDVSSIQHQKVTRAQGRLNSIPVLEMSPGVGEHSFLLGAGQVSSISGMIS
jgi:hypothetical protein